MLGDSKVSNRQRITKRLVDALEPGQTTWDEELTGFGVRRQSRNASYVLKCSVQGRQRFFTIGRHGVVTVEQARTEARRLLGLIAGGADPTAARTTAALKADTLTVEALCAMYLNEGPAFKPNKKATSWYTDRSNISRHIVPLLGATKARELTEAQVSAFVHGVINGATKIDQKAGLRGRAIVRGGIGVAARALAVLSAVYGFGERRKLVGSNPTKFVKAPKGQTPGRFLKADEWQRLGAAIKRARHRGRRSFTDAILLLAMTGCRRSEITRLHWCEVDLVGGMLRLRDSKSGPRTVPLGDQAVALLAALKSQAADSWVFPSVRGAGPIVGIQKVWMDIRAEAGLPKVRLHDLRHSFASQAVSGGATLYMTGVILGHRQNSTTQRYAHIQDDPARIVASQVAKGIHDALGLSAQPVPYLSGRGTRASSGQSFSS